jgi:hypothetical protein
MGRSVYLKRGKSVFPARTNAKPGTLRTIWISRGYGDGTTVDRHPPVQVMP